jgi:hypothetical protein
MMFEIQGEDNQRILDSLKEFQALAESEYKIELEKAKEKIKKISFLSPVIMKIPLPDEMIFFSWEENGMVFLRMPIYTPKILKVMGKTRMLENNLKLFLESKGLKIKSVKHKGD